MLPIGESTVQQVSPNPASDLKHRTPPPSLCTSFLPFSLPSSFLSGPSTNLTPLCTPLFPSLPSIPSCSHSSSLTSLPPSPSRSVRHPWRGDGQAVLPQVHGRLHPQVVPPPPHRRGLLRHRLPPHALHGAPRVPAQEARQPVCPQVGGFRTRRHTVHLTWGLECHKRDFNTFRAFITISTSKFFRRKRNNNISVDIVRMFIEPSAKHQQLIG